MGGGGGGGGGRESGCRERLAETRETLVKHLSVNNEAT